MHYGPGLVSKSNMTSAISGRLQVAIASQSSLCPVNL